MNFKATSYLVISDMSRALPGTFPTMPHEWLGDDKLAAAFERFETTHAAAMMPVRKPGRHRRDTRLNMLIKGAAEVASVALIVAGVLLGVIEF